MGGIKLPILIGLLVGTMILSLAGNFFYLKATVKWPEVPDSLLDTTMVEEEVDKLRLTWDISGEARSPEELQTKMDEQKAEQQEKIKSMVDSVVTEETTPLKQDMDKTKEELQKAKEQVNELEDLLATISAQADSIDKINAKKLSKMLEGMKPQKAAAILTRLNTNVNAQLLLKMRQKQAAKILSELPQERAAAVAKVLSEAYARSTI